MPEKTVTVLVASGKAIDFDLPKGYRLIQVGSSDKRARFSEILPGILHDDEGDNISSKNAQYCELTAQYWGWKNIHTDIKGLCHYRRFFSGWGKPALFDTFFVPGSEVVKAALNADGIRDRLTDHDIILTLPYLPYPDNGLTDLRKYVFDKDIRRFRKMFLKKYHSDPGLTTALDCVLRSRHLSYCNMFITRSEIYDQYSEWLFEVLESFEQITDLSGYDPQHARIYGYLSEVLLNVWIHVSHLKPAYVEMLSVSEYNQNSAQANFFSRIQRYAVKPPVEPLYNMYYRLRYPDIYKRMLACKEYIQ